MSSFFSRKCILPPLLHPKSFVPKLRHQEAHLLVGGKITMAYLETDLCLILFFCQDRLKFALESEFIFKKLGCWPFYLNLSNLVLKNGIQVSKWLGVDWCRIEIQVEICRWVLATSSCKASFIGGRLWSLGPSSMGWATFLAHVLLSGCCHGFTTTMSIAGQHQSCWLLKCIFHGLFTFSILTEGLYTSPQNL